FAYCYLDDGLLDRPTPTDWVGVTGTGEATGNESAISGTFKGRFDYYITAANVRFVQGVPSGCAANPDFTLRRQCRSRVRRFCMRARSLLLAMAVAAVFVACGGDDGPSPPTVPTLCGAPTKIEISGATALTTVGQQSQLTANATFANGQTRNVSSQAQ